MDHRLAMLEGLVSSGSVDSFTLYALAMEYRSKGRIADAIEAFSTLRDLYPEYVPGYMMAGTMLIGEDRKDEARVWLTQGIEEADAAGNAHARDEMKKLLVSIG